MMAIEFRLLGEVGASVDRRIIELGHARQRCVLTALLVDANRVVPVDQLLDRVWAHRPPQRSRTTLSNYLSRLRQTLTVASEVALVRQTGGYKLTVDPMAVDLHRFRRLVRDARATEDRAEAASLFTRALDLWRGEAFATLQTPWLNGIRETLDVERHAAELDRIDLALDLGDHAAVLADASRLAAVHPLDERVAGQLMLALYRCGRQADALYHYERVRRRLAGELGADPSPPLRTLHKQILATDAALAATAPPSAPAAWLPVPRQLPPPPRGFTGRTQELARLDAILTQGAGGAATTVVISAVSGTAGVGKTALALYWAHRVADRFPGGQLYVNLRGFDAPGSVVSVAEAVRGFLDAFDVPPHRVPAGLDAQIGLYRSLTAGRRVLVVLDNARNAEQLRLLLPGTSGCLVLVTSRNQLTGLVAAEGAYPIDLDLLTPAEARELFAERVGPARAAAEPDALDEIVERCARLPLALTVVAARAATHPRFPLAVLARELGQARNALHALTAADPATDVRAAFACSYDALSPPAARLFRHLGLHPGPDFTAPAAASLAAVPEPEVRRLLAELARAHVIAERGTGRYAFHDLLRAYASELVEAAEPEAERRAATHRMLDHYLHTARSAVRLLEPCEPIHLAPARDGVSPEQLADPAGAIAWLAVEHQVLLACVGRAVEDGFDIHTWQLPWTLTAVSDRGLRSDDQVAIQTAAVAAARRLADRAGQAWAHRNLARAYARSGRCGDAHTEAQRALDLFVELGDRTGQAYTRLGLGWTFDHQGHHAQALVHDQRALDLFRDIGDRVGQAIALNNVGWCHVQLGRHHDAIAHCEQALALFQTLGNTLSEANTWDSLGFAHHELGDHARAAACYRHAVDTFREYGPRYNEADTLARLGDTLVAGGDRPAAEHAWRQALDVLTELDHPAADRLRARLDARGAKPVHAATGPSRA